MNLFEKLAIIKHFKFKAIAGKKSSTNWNGAGEGNVSTSIKDNKLFFKEDGFFKLDENPRAIKIFNEYIWTQLSNNRLRLSHSRFGYDSEIILFELKPIAIEHWVSSEAHVCGNDLYSAELKIINSTIKLSWIIKGPKKDEFIAYTYTSPSTK